MVSHAKIGTRPIQPRDRGVAGATYIFCLPGSPGACRDAWDEFLVHQLDYRYRPCNFVEIMPRLDEHLRRARPGVPPETLVTAGVAESGAVRRMRHPAAEAATRLDLVSGLPALNSPFDALGGACRRQ